MYSVLANRKRQSAFAEGPFEELFVSQFVSMRQFAQLLGADDPEDVAQEAFVRVHRHWGQLRDPGKALAYLRRTVANLATSRLRRLKISRKHPEPRPVDVVSAETSALNGGRLSALWGGVQGLPRRQRQVVVLRYWMDFDVEQVASVLGISRGTVTATTSHALARLRTEVGAS